jgi:carboxyl-terminal processing protease
LINEMQADDKELEQDIGDDPRFAMTAEQLKAKGIEDFQLHYAMETLQRLGSKTMRLAEKPALKGKAQN